MKRITHVASMVIALLMLWMAGCQPQPDEMTLEQQATVADTITALMNDLIANAEATNAAKAGAPLLADSTAIFFLSGVPYSKEEMMVNLDSMYAGMGWQKIEFEYSQVYVLSPDVALWVGYGINIYPKGEEEVTYRITDSFMWQRKNGQWGISHFHESGVPVVPEVAE